MSGKSFVDHSQCLDEKGILNLDEDGLKAALPDLRKILKDDPSYSPYLTERAGDPCGDLRVNGL